MDGTPVRGESVPIRMFLEPYGLSPTLTNVHQRLSVSYLFNLVLIDSEDRRYFKSQEVTLYRAREDPAVAEGGQHSAMAHSPSDNAIHGMPHRDKTAGAGAEYTPRPYVLAK